MKYISLILACVLLATSCGKTIESSQAKKETPIDDQIANAVNLDEEILAINKLLSSEKPNIALAELLLNSKKVNLSKEIKDLIKKFSIDDAKEVLERFQKENEVLREKILFHGEKYQDNQDLRRGMIKTRRDIGVNSLSHEQRLTVSLIAYAKNDSLDKIIKAYDLRASQLANDISSVIAFEIARDEQDLSSEIDLLLNKRTRQEIVAILTKSKPFLVKVDKYFKSSDLNENEQYTVVMSGIIAGAIYSQIYKTKGFKNFLREAQSVINDVKEIHSKAKEFAVLVNSLESHIHSTQRNLQNLDRSIRGTRQDISALFGRAEIATQQGDRVSAKRIYEFLHGVIISGKKPSDSTNDSILSESRRVNENINRTFTAVGGLADNLTNILTTTQRMSAVFGVKLSKDVARVIDTAQKVSAAVNTAKMVMAGFATGGYLGAIGAFSSSPGMSMLGGGDPSAAKLDEISRKLDVVLENQKKMMQMQVETMNMIKELAIMVDAYHQREMLALAELRDLSLVNLEISRSIQNQGIRACERMIKFQLSIGGYNESMSSASDDTPFYKINQVSATRELLLKSTNSRAALASLVSSSDEKAYSECHSALADAFSGTQADESPVRGIFASSENDNLLRFQRESFAPLLHHLQTITRFNSLDSIPLHLPASKLSDLAKKVPYLESAGNIGTSLQTHYRMTSLISSINLERYLGSLMILHPVFEFDKLDWRNSLTALVDTYLTRFSNLQGQSRSIFYLKNSLKLVQTAIAQEALLAGEILLPSLHDDLADKILSKGNCEESSTGLPRIGGVSILCSVRGNKLLMRNFLAYVLYYHQKTNPNVIKDYTSAYALRDLEKIAKILSVNLTSTDLKFESRNDEDVLVLELLSHRGEKQKIKVPKPEEVRIGELMYSENLHRLLVMQDMIVDEIQKVSSVGQSYNNFDLFKIVLMSI